MKDLSSILKLTIYFLTLWLQSKEFDFFLNPCTIHHDHQGDEILYVALDIDSYTPPDDAWSAGLGVHRCGPPSLWTRSAAAGFGLPTGQYNVYTGANATDELPVIVTQRAWNFGNAPSDVGRPVARVRDRSGGRDTKSAKWPRRTVVPRCTYIKRTQCRQRSINGVTAVPRRGEAPRGTHAHIARPSSPGGRQPWSRERLRAQSLDLRGVTVTTTRFKKFQMF